jgi:hypothetical protein
MDGLQGTKDLVDKVLAVVIREGLCSDDPVEIGLHEFLDEVDLIEFVERRRLGDVQNGDDLSASWKSVSGLALMMIRIIFRIIITFSLTHCSEKYLSSLSSRSVRRQKSECSKGRMRLMATCLPVGLWSAATTVP